MKQKKVFFILALLLMTATGAWAQDGGTLNGKFTINASGDKVYFAQGNLQAVCTSADGNAATPENFTWRFAEHQWDYIGGTNNLIDGNGSVSAAGTVDLFSWVGASSTLTGTAAYGLTNAGGGTDGTGNNANDKLKSDWGNLFGDGWFTLSGDEWAYLLNTRSTASGVRFAKANVNNVPGIIVLPDDWSTSYYALNSTNTASVGFDANVISSADWISSLEAHDAVFLPIAGLRIGGSIVNIGVQGFYWTSTSAADVKCACALTFHATAVEPKWSDGVSRRYGSSVRLVKNVRSDVTGVTLNASTATLTVGGTTTLTPTFTPSNATNKNVTWSSSNTSVATVSNSGVVTAVGLGSATITATATATNGTADPSDDVTATCTVTVATPINAVSEDGTIGAFTDANGQTRMGIVVTLNGNKYAISMSNETDISGLSGTYTKKVGDYTYYNFADACAKFANNQTNGSYTASNVWRLPTAAEFQNLIALGGSWNGTGYTWTIGGNSLFLPAAGYIDNPSYGLGSVGFYWSSTQPQFLYFYNGGISMPNGGTQSGMPLRLFCQLPYTAVTGVTLSPTEASLIVGETTTLTPTVAPATATDMTVTWTTSDASVATVTDGVVTAVGAGTATITVTTTDGSKTATCAVTVNPLTLTANEGATGEYWATYYNGTTSFTADENTTVFQAALSGSSLTLTEVPNREIPATKAVILKSSSATITLTPASTTETLEGNELQGTTAEMTGAAGNIYVLNKKSDVVGFYKLSSTGTIGANKAYLTYSGGAGAREFFLFDEATGIEMPTAEVIDADAVVYDLQGRRVAQPTKGLYIVNGKKVIIK